ncbi:MAG: hypothetical protein M3478_15140 [Planctomycetota bacterium]|nr:hypothetical protein [Planctomycetota bacterium]
MEPERPDRFDDGNGPRRWSARWWFARFAFSFVVLAAVAAYEGYRARERGDSSRATLLFATAAAGAALGFAAVRTRHRP